MSSNHWDTLIQAFTAKTKARRESAAQAQALSDWYDEHTKLVMTLVREVAVERAATFAQQAGIQIEVEWPSHPPINVGPDGPFMSFMMLSVGERQVHLYSHRIGGTPPSLHYAVHETNHRNLLGRPGCRIERRDGGGFLLRSATSSRDTQILSIDDVAYRAFELLLS